MRRMASALGGLRVVEVATGVAGPYCGRLLAGLGAEVVKVEPPAGDPTRLAGPFPNDVHDIEKSGLFLHLNAGKSSVVFADGEREAALIESLLPDADVVILGWRPGELAERGIELDRWRQRWPRLVITSVTPFGLTGPYANWRGGELVVFALGGYMMLTGSPEREPLKAYGELVQYQAGVHAAVGTLTALRASEATGDGQVVDVSAMEAATFLLGGVEQQAFFEGKIARRNGTRLLGFPPEHSYPSTIRRCADGFVHCHSNNRYLDLLGALIPHPRLADPELLHAMMLHADEVDAIMDEWLADKPRTEVVERAQEMRLPFTEVMTPREVLAVEHHVERGSFVEVEHPKAGRLVQPGAPMRMSATPWETKAAPLLGSETAGAVARRWAAIDVRAFAAGAEQARPLAGIRVVDFTTAVAGPVASSIFAVLGADVIKVEAPGSRPRKAAGTAPLLEGAADRPWDRLLLFNAFNHGKRSLSLDVTEPRGRDVFLRLVATADVVVQNFAPRVLPNLGLDYEALRAVKKEIILVSMPAFGLDGPLRDRVSYGPGIDAMSGLSHLTGYADGPPMKPGNFFCDQNAALHAAFSTIAALRHRDSTGEGQHVELAMIEGEFQILADAYMDVAMNGRERSRTGNDHATFAPHGVFRCKGEDAWVAIAVASDAQWRAFCAALGSPELASDPRFITSGERHRNRAALTPVIEGWTSVRDHYTVQEALQGAGVPAGAVLDAGELLVNAHVVARHGFEHVDTEGVGRTPYPRVAFVLSGTPVSLQRPAPPFGRPNTDVLTELGFSAAEMAALQAAGIVSAEPRGGGSH